VPFAFAEDLKARRAGGRMKESGDLRERKKEKRTRGKKRGEKKGKGGRRCRSLSADLRNNNDPSASGG